MSLWRHLTRGLRVLVQRPAADQDVADEVQHYFDETAAALEATGLPRDAARRAAQLTLGNTTAVREQVRAYGWENVVGALIADLRYAVRRLRNNPGFTTVCLATLALGIGASTAIFSAVNPILFEPLPYRHADRIVMISDYGVDGSSADVTFGTYRELAVRSRSFDALAVMKAWQPTMTGPTEPERWDAQRVSARYFRALGVSPAMGRDFLESHDRHGGPNVVILGDALWRRRFGGDSTIIGRVITLDGDSYTVIGVMPNTFENVLAPGAALWAPLQYDASLASFGGREWGHHLRMIGRLRPGIDAAQAAREIERIARARVAEFTRPPWASFERGLMVHSLQGAITSAIRPALLAVLGAVILVLAIACVNVANLLLARGAQRRGELSLRAALGASRARMLRQLLTESVVLALLGGVAGIAVAELGVRALVALSPPALPRANAIAVDRMAFAFALGLGTLVGLVIGLVPALTTSRGDLHLALHESSRRTAGARRVTRRALVVVEVALALVLLVSAGLLLRSLQRLFAVSPGFDPSHLLTLQVQVSGHGYDSDSVRYRFFSQALDAVRRVPGVSAAAFTSQLPLSGDLDLYGAHLESPSENPVADPSALRYSVSPGYVEAMRIPLRGGRTLDEHDVAGSPVSVLVSESFAARRFPGRDAIGQRFRFGADTAWFTIVGVVGEVKQTSLAMSRADAVYITTSQWMWVDNRLSLVVRTRGDPAALVPAVRSAIWSVDKDQPIARVATMNALLAATAAERRFSLVVFEAFALAALALAATGIYGVLSGGVAERMREIGVRSALGASRAEILALVLGQGLRLTALGVGIGLTGAVAATRALIALLFGVSPLDPLTYLGVVVLLVGVSGIACAVPAWRAARIDPTITLRAD